MQRALSGAPRAAPGAYHRIYSVVARIARGKVATYGQVAKLAGQVTARQVGYAMAACPERLPWQRVINAKGEVSPRKHGDGQLRQRARLERERVRFDARGRVDLARHRWLPRERSSKA